MSRRRGTGEVGAVLPVGADHPGSRAAWLTLPTPSGNDSRVANLLRQTRWFAGSNCHRTRPQPPTVGRLARPGRRLICLTCGDTCGLLVSPSQSVASAPEGDEQLVAASLAGDEDAFRCRNRWRLARRYGSAA